MITTKAMFTREHDRLDPDVSAKAFVDLKACKSGKWLTDYIDGKGVVVEINFVKAPNAIPGVTGNPAGFCDPVPRGKHYQVWVAAGYEGQASQVECPNHHKIIVPDSTTLYDRFICKKCQKETIPGLTFVPWPKDRPAKEIAKTTFHELLHAWFMTAFPNGTGHDGSVEPEVQAFGMTTYSSHGYDPDFLEKLKQFEQEIR